MQRENASVENVQVINALLYIYENDLGIFRTVPMWFFGEVLLPYGVKYPLLFCEICKIRCLSTILDSSLHIFSCSGNTDFHGLHGFSHEPIRKIRENPLNPCPIAIYSHTSVSFTPFKNHKKPTKKPTKKLVRSPHYSCII